METKIKILMRLAGSALVFLSALFLFASPAVAEEVANNSVAEESSAQQILQGRGLEEFAGPLDLAASLENLGDFSAPLENFLAPLSSPGSALDLFIPDWRYNDKFRIERQD